jgi:hypothetical protein
LLGGGLVDFILYFVVFSTMFSLPTLGIVWWLRGRINRATGALVVGLSYAVVAAILFWRVEWFDIYRHGLPPLGYIVESMGPVVLILGLIGGSVGAILARPITE